MASVEARVLAGADPIAGLIDALDEGEMPEVVRKVVAVVITALAANNDRIAGLARLHSGNASQEELHEITDAVLADVRQSAEAAHSRHFDTLESIRQLEVRFGGRLEAASTASADAFVALETSVLQRVTERAASRSALDLALGRIDELGARLERLEGAHVTPAQISTLSSRADEAGERVLLLEGGRSQIEGAISACAHADEHSALAAEVEALVETQREFRTQLDGKGFRADLIDAQGRVRLLEERAATSDSRLNQFPSPSELRGAVDDRERVRKLELDYRSAREALDLKVSRDELAAALATMAATSDVNGARAAVRQTRDDYRSLAAVLERRVDAARAEAAGRAEALDEACRELGDQIADATARTDARVERIANEGSGGIAGLSHKLDSSIAELARKLDLSAQQSALHAKAVTSELLAEVERRAVAVDVRELWEETQSQLSVLAASDAQLRAHLEDSLAHKLARAEEGEAALAEARKLLSDGRALQEVLRRELASKAGHSELVAEARRAAREAVEPLLSLQRAELDERASELRKSLAERAAVIRDSISEELGELQRQIRGKAAAADVQGAAAEVRATLGASQEARMAEMRADNDRATQDALAAFRKNVRRTLALASDETKAEMKAAVEGHVAMAIAVGTGELEARMAGKADAVAMEAAQRSLAAAERELSHKLDATQLDAALARVDGRAGGMSHFSLEGGESAPDALRRLNLAVSRAAGAEELQRVTAEHRAVLEPVWAETQLGKWAWSSHKLRTTERSTLRLVPWDVQRINTDPGGFSWEPLQTSVTVAQSGPYALTAAFFSRRRPLTVRLFVNGSPVLAKASDGQAKHIDASGRVAGVVMQSVIMLPRNAQVAVEYVGDEREATGMLALRRL